nr:putative aldo-keto reductase 1 [Quercus suber]
MAEGNKLQIPRVKLGNQGLEVSKLGFGCMSLTGVYNSPLPEEDGIAVIKYYLVRESLSLIHLTFMDPILMKFCLERP